MAPFASGACNVTNLEMGFVSLLGDAVATVLLNFFN